MFPTKYDDFKRLIFSELLAVSVKPDKPRQLYLIDITRDHIGSLYTSIRSNPKIQHFKISNLLHLTNAFGHSEMAATESTINSQLHVIKENYCEYLVNAINNPGYMKSLALKQNMPGGNSFVSFICDRHDENHEYKIQKLFTIKQDKYFITQAGDIILKRFWAISGFVGSIELESIDVSGVISKVIYSCEPMKLMEVNGKQIEVIEIKKTAFIHGTELVITKSLLLTSGHLIHHEFCYKNCWYVASSPTFSGNPPINFEINWLKSNNGSSDWLRVYHDIKQGRLTELQEFIKQFPEIQNMIRDYILCLTLEKPNDVIEFTFKYFSNFFKNR